MKIRPAHIQSLIMLGIVSISAYSYLNFSNFDPALTKNGTQLGSNIKSNSIKIPIPENSKLIAQNNSKDGEQVTLTAFMTPQEAQTYYKNLMTSNDWILDSEGEAGIFLTSTYKNKTHTVTITSSPQEELNSTVIIIDTKSN